MSEKRLPKAVSGRADELEAAKLSTHGYKIKPHTLLPDPPGIPFEKQGQPIPDPYNRHTTYREVIHMEDPDADDNALACMYWTGVSKKQINQGGPTFRLGVNENRNACKK